MAPSEKKIKCTVVKKGVQRLGGKGNYTIGETVDLTAKQIANRVNKVVATNEYIAPGSEPAGTDKELKAELAKVTQERDAMDAGGKALFAENEELKGGVLLLTVERDAFEEELAKVTQERDAGLQTASELETQLEAVTKERDSALKAVEELTTAATKQKPPKKAGK